MDRSSGIYALKVEHYVRLSLVFKCSLQMQSGQIFNLLKELTRSYLKDFTHPTHLCILTYVFSTWWTKQCRQHGERASMLNISAHIHLFHAESQWSIHSPSTHDPTPDQRPVTPKTITCSLRLDALHSISQGAALFLTLH